MSEPVTARAQTDYMDTGFRPGLPGSTQVLKKFAPLPKRQSPKPWDGAAIAAHYERMNKNIGVEDPNRPSALSGVPWFSLLTPMKVGDEKVIHATRASIGKAASHYGRLLNREFQYAEIGFREYRVTRMR